MFCSEPATGPSLHTGNTVIKVLSTPILTHYLNAMGRWSQTHVHQVPITQTISPILFPIPTGCQPASFTVVFYKFSSYTQHANWGKGAHTAEIWPELNASPVLPKVWHLIWCVLTPAAHSPLAWGACPCFSAILLPLNPWQSNFLVSDWSQLQQGNSLFLAPVKMA